VLSEDEMNGLHYDSDWSEAESALYPDDRHVEFRANQRHI